MKISNSEIIALQRAVDFIASNANGADDFRPYQKMMNKLTQVWKRGIKENSRKLKIKG